VLSRIDSLAAELFDSSPAASVRHARQIGLIAFTPSNIITDEAQQADRPYASLLFASNGRVRVDADDRGAWTSSLTVGFPRSACLHSCTTSCMRRGFGEAAGYDHQISAGGEPTARYMLARHNWCTRIRRAASM
jgi:hypothetical protein